jgi:GAF domain-containing protein
LSVIMPSEISTASADPLVSLRRELAEAREQQTATAEILAAISSSRTSPDRVFARIAASAARLCGAYDATIFELVGDQLRIVAQHGETVAALPIGQGISLSRGRVAGRAVLDRETIHVADLQSETVHYPEGSAAARRLGHRSIVSVPLMCADEAVGVISIRRGDVRPFTDRQIELLKVFANQAVIAIENTRLFEAEQASKRELQVSLDYQTALADVLNVISRSPTELQPVLDSIAATAARLCESIDAQVWRVESGKLVVVAQCGSLLRPGSAFPELPLARGSVTGRAIIDRETIHVHDLASMVESEYPDVKDRQKLVGQRTTLATPLLIRGESAGAITVRRTEVRPFSDRQIALLQTFADQAVIAIENTRLFEAEQASKRELQESLEYQTAISNVLGVISASPNDVRPAYQNIVETAYRLCKADRAGVWRLEEGSFRIVAAVNPLNAHSGHRAVATTPLDRSSLAGRVGLERRTVHIPDILVDPEYDKFRNRPGDDRRSMLGVPLLRLGQVIGAIILSRTRLEPFSQREIRLVETFADQAIIAIENTRLFDAEQASKRELQESLEYQTATSEVLNVISRSPTDVQPVFDTIARSAAQLCEAQFCHVFRFDGELVHLAASHGASPEALEELKKSTPMAANRGFAVGRAILSNAIEEIPDIFADPDYAHRDVARAGTWRSVTAVPMRKDGRPIGAIGVNREQPGRFSDRQIELLQTFADQAVIAIENTRLFEAEQARTREVTERTRELTEALEQQTATAEVLKVISRSALDVQKVLDALVESAARLCDAYDAAIWQVLGDDLRLVAHHGQIPFAGPVGQFTVPLVRGFIAGRVVIDRRTIHVEDALAEGDEYPDARTLALQLGWRTALGVPLVHAGEAIGAILIRRAEVRPFTERQIELVNTFADQAVIAIENTRLFEEVQAKTAELGESLEYQTATSDVLDVISRSPTDVQPVFDAIAQSAARLFAPCIVGIVMREGNNVLLRGLAGATDPDHDALATHYPVPFDPGNSIASLAMSTRKVVEIPDTEAPNTRETLRAVLITRDPQPI